MTKQQNKHYIFSNVLSALTKLYTTYINMHGALTCNLGKIGIFPTFVNINFTISFSTETLKCLEPHTAHVGIRTESTMKTHRTGNMRQVGAILCEICELFL